MTVDDSISMNYWKGLNVALGDSIALLCFSNAGIKGSSDAVGNWRAAQWISFLGVALACHADFPPLGLAASAALSLLVVFLMEFLRRRQVVPVVYRMAIAFGLPLVVYGALDLAWPWRVIPAFWLAAAWLWTLFGTGGVLARRGNDEGH